MNAKQFTSSSIALLRSAVGWQTAIAKKLDVKPRTIRRWLHAGEAPAWVDKWFSEKLGLKDVVAWPRDEWTIGEARDATSKIRTYIHHLQPPVFTARVVYCNPAGDPLEEEQPADVSSGVVYVALGDEVEGDIVLCEIDWIDAVAPGEHAKWLDAASDVFLKNALDD